MKRLFQALAAVSLIVCIVAPVRYFWGDLSVDGYKDLFLAGTVGWFVFATLAMSRGKAQ